MVAFRKTTPNERDRPQPINMQGIPGVHVLTAEEGRIFFDRRVHETLGITGDDFLRRWDAGEYALLPDTVEGRKIGRLVMMLPFARPTLD